MFAGTAGGAWAPGRAAWLQIPPQLVTGGAPSDRGLNLSEPRLLHLRKRIITTAAASWAVRKNAYVDRVGSRGEAVTRSR